MKLLSGILHTEAQTLRGALPKAPPQSLQKLPLHQIQLLRPDGIRAAHHHLSPALGDGAGDRCYLLANYLGPGSLQCCQRRLRGRLVKRRPQGGRGWTRGSAPGHAAAASLAASGIRTTLVEAEAGRESSAAAVINV